MLVKRSLFYILTFILMFSLLIYTNDVFLSGSITIFIMITWYIVESYKRRYKRLNLIDELCDPEAFIEATEKQRKITGKNKRIDTYLNMDKAGGLVALGEFEKAKEILHSIDKAYLSQKNETLLLYTLNLMYCHYGLCEFDLAEKIFERELPLLRPFRKGPILAVKAIIGKRYFNLGRYDESKEQYELLLKQKTSKRVYLSIVYILAQIDEALGNLESAKEKYKEVADRGNKLWITIQAKQSLKEIQNRN